MVHAHSFTSKEQVLIERFEPTTFRLVVFATHSVRHFLSNNSCWLDDKQNCSN